MYFKSYVVSFAEFDLKQQHCVRQIDKQQEEIIYRFKAYRLTKIFERLVGQKFRVRD